MERSCRRTSGCKATLHIEIVKRADGAGVLRCTRQDGSVTWQKQARHAVHFALHDLTHYAVETTLGYRRGFFGLIAEGWNVEDTTGKGVRGALPAEALEVEQIVGLFDSERSSGALWSVDEFNEFTGHTFTLVEIQNIRAMRADLFRKWFEVPPGERLELKFERTLPNRSNSPSIAELLRLEVDEIPRRSRKRRVQKVLESYKSVTGPRYWRQI